MALSIAIAKKNTLLASFGAYFNGGILRVYAGAEPATADAGLGGATTLGTLTYGNPAFVAPVAGSMTANAITQDAAADNTGTASFFRSFEVDGTTVIEQGTVTDDPAAWQALTLYVLGQRVSNGGNIYQATAGGTSASSGGPAGTGGSISDGTVTWAYQSALGQLRLNTTSIVAGGPIQVSSLVRNF